MGDIFFVSYHYAGTTCSASWNPKLNWEVKLIWYNLIINIYYTLIWNLFEREINEERLMLSKE